MRTALVVGTGLIGTSAALALAGRGVTVHLADHDPEQARTAAALGAGTDEAPEGPVDLAIVAAPPRMWPGCSPTRCGAGWLAGTSTWPA